MSLALKSFHLFHSIMAAWQNCDVYCRDSLITSHFCPGRSESLRNPWIDHVVLWCCKHVSALDGIYVEAGVFTGQTARIIQGELGDASQLWLLDSWNGPDIGQNHAAGATITADWNAVFDSVTAKFSCDERVKLVRGYVHATIESVPNQPVRFLHLDLNSAEPERLVLDTLWPRMVRGGVVLHDDYGHRGFEAQRKMIDAHCTLNNIMPLVMPTGQALFIKP